MKHDWTADLLTYWDRLRGTRAAPDRRDISPRGLGSKLPVIFILRNASENADDSSLSEVSNDSKQFAQAKQWQFRLAGTRLCALYGRELRNTRFLSLWNDDVRPWLAEQLHLSGLDYRPLRLEHTSHTLSGKTCTFETLLLPLHEADGTLGWIGSMVALDQPLWLGSDPLIINQMGLTLSDPLGVETPLPAFEEANTASDMKSVLHALLERHQETLKLSADIVTAAPDFLAAGVAVQAVHVPTPAVEDIMPNAAQHMHNLPQQSGSAAPLTVADLIRSIHPVAPVAAATPTRNKSSHLKLISGGKDRT